jgi:flagellar hook assembly protein FlgD
MKGQLVNHLVNEDMNPGIHNVVWNGKDENGRNVSSGVYLYRLESGTYQATRKMLLMK